LEIRMKTYTSRFQAWSFIGIAASAACVALSDPAQAAAARGINVPVLASNE
jgi:hypothetical protein